MINIKHRICPALLLMLSTASVRAAAPFDTNWGKWGKDDHIGTLNYVTAEKVVEAAKLVKKGVVFNLAIDLTPDTASWTGRTYQHYNWYITPSFSNEGGAGAADDMIIMHLQYSTQWDGLSHASWDGVMYNGFKQPNISLISGSEDPLSIHQWAERIVTRGVLLDIARYKGVPNLEMGYEITPADLKLAAKAQKVEVRSGDILLVRTGWMNVMKKWPTPLRGDEPIDYGEPGIGLAATQWLKQDEVAAIALDNLAAEVIPSNPDDDRKVNDKGDKGFAVHTELLVHQGMPIGELWNFEDLAEDCASDGVYEFFLAAPPLRVVGGHGSVLSPLAIK